MKLKIMSRKLIWMMRFKYKYTDLSKGLIISSWWSPGSTLFSSSVVKSAASERISRENSFERSRRTKSKDDFGRTDVNSSSRDVELEIWRDLMVKLLKVYLLQEIVRELEKSCPIGCKNVKLCGFYQIACLWQSNFLRIFDNFFDNIFCLNI